MGYLEPHVGGNVNITMDIMINMARISEFKNYGFIQMQDWAKKGYLEPNVGENVIMTMDIIPHIKRMSELAR